MGKMQYPATPEMLVEGVDKLVSLPEVCFLVNDLVNDPLSELPEIGQVISQDPDLTARLLKLVNSSYYGFQTKIDTVSRAILVIGLKELQHMVWSTSAVETFNHVAPKDTNMATFWRHSIFTAVVARILAREANVLHPERMFVSGLLHDIGRLLILIKLPDAVNEMSVLDKTNQDKRPSEELEQAVLGYTHSEVGAALFKSWDMPESIVESIKHHHAPSNADEYHFEACILHIANIVAHALEIGEEENLQQIGEPGAWSALNLRATRIKPILHEAVMQFLESLELLLPGASQRV